MLVVFYFKFTTEPSILQTWWHYILSDYDAQRYGNSGFTSLGASKHFGLMGMEKRAQLIGAEFSVSSAADEGTQIRIFKR